MSEATLPEPFDYHSLDEQTRLLVQQKTDETHGLLKRTTEGIIAIGNNLLAVQKLLPEMKFSAWLRAEFDLSRRSAYNFMKVATRFGGSCATVAQLPAQVLYELAFSSDAIVEQVETGQLPPKVNAIKAAKEAERQAKEAEQQVRLELQIQQATVEQLTRDLEQVRQELVALSLPEIQIKEVERQVIPPEIAEQLEALQHDVIELTQQRDTLTTRVSALGDEINLNASKRFEGEHERQVRLKWYKITSEFQRSVHSMLSQWPSPLDVLTFEADDWTRLSHVKELARRFLAECTRLTDEPNARIVEGSRVTNEYEQEGL